MSDLISRQAAIDALDESIKHFDDMAEECRRNANIERNDYMDMRDDAAEYKQLSIWLNELKWLRKRFQSQPERKKGKWIKEVMHYKDESQDFYYERTCCSVCGVKKRIGWYDAKYCPRCGADMRGESDE